MNELVPTGSATLPSLVAAAGDRVSMRFLAANTCNAYTCGAHGDLRSDPDDCQAGSITAATNTPTPPSLT